MKVRIYMSTLEANEEAVWCEVCEGVMLARTAAGADDDLMGEVCGRCLPHLVGVERELGRLEAVTGVRQPSEVEVYELQSK